MNNDSVYIITFGCQMNIYDSQQISRILLQNGYNIAKTIDEANLVIINTCTVRQKAEQKALSFLGNLKKIKRNKSSLIIAVGGCLAQRYGKKLLQNTYYIDIVFGTNAIFRLPDLVNYVRTLKSKIVDVNFLRSWPKKKRHFYNFSNNIKKSAFVTVMRGCNNFCTYCVVPYVRGREISRNPQTIVKEIEKLVSFGVREVTLVGQNVNSYGLKEGFISFSQLLNVINKIYNIKRIRFITSHPKDLSNDLIDSFSKLDKLCKHIHLPVQSGNNIVLKRMNRKYTKEVYVNKINRLRSRCPNIAVTTDFIVGFPGESVRQFNDTVNLLNEVSFDNSFIFSYSDINDAIASKFKNKINNKIKLNRMQKLIKLQKFISITKNKLMVGKIKKILVEGKSYNLKYKNHEYKMLDYINLVGRTSCNKIVHFTVPANSNLNKILGFFVSVRIVKAESFYLYGKLVE